VAEGHIGKKAMESLKDNIQADGKTHEIGGE